MDRSRYPADWDEISRAIKERAGWCCEECGVDHRRFIIRDERDQSLWHYATDEEFYGGAAHVVQVWLTVHHVGVEKPDGSPGSPHDKMDNRPENLAALCQRCHLLADLNSHQQKSRATRIRKKHEQRLEAGQGELF
jgi:hypothetical protein